MESLTCLPSFVQQWSSPLCQWTPPFFGASSSAAPAGFVHSQVEHSGECNDFQIPV